MILVTYTHRISALGDSSAARYGVNNIFQRDTRTHVRTDVRTYARTNIILVRRKCCFGAIVLIQGIITEIIDTYRDIIKI